MATTDIGIKLSLQGANEVQSGLDRVGTGLRGMATNAKESVSSVKELALAMGAAFSVKAIIDAADAVTTLRNQLKLATGSASEAKTAYAALFDVAQRARVSFTDLGGTYASLARAGEQLGVSQQRLLGVTEAISNAVTISGGSAESAKAALVQLSQGLASGTLRGDELNSVMEQTPRLASALAAGLGVTTGELRKLGEAGEITADKVIRALESQAGVLKGEVAGSVLTVGQAWQQLQNASVKTIGDFDAATGASAALASAMQALAGAITTVGQAAREHETATKVFFGLIAGAAVATTVGAIASALGGLVTAIGGIGGVVATVGAVIAAANPVTLALLGIGAAVGAVAAYSSAQGKNLDTVSQKISDISQEITELDAAIERSKGAKGVLLGNGAVTTKERANDLVADLRKQRAEMQALLAENTAPSASMLLRRMDNQEDAAARAQDKINAEQIEKARALVKTKNAILDAGYKEAVTIAQNYQGAIDAAEKSGDTDKQRELIAQRSALLIASAKETAEAVKSFNERDTATAREAAKERLEVQIAGYERAGQAFDDYQKQQQKSLETAHALGLTSESAYIRAKEQLELGVNQGKQDLAQQELQAVQKSGLLQKDRIAQEQKYTTEIQKLKAQQVQIAQDAADAIEIANYKELQSDIEANTKTIVAARDRATQLEEQLRAQQAANKEIGLSAREVIALRTATAELTAVELERRAANSDDSLYAQALRDQAAAIRGIAAANAEALEKSAAVEQFNRVWESVDRTAHDTFVNIFEGGQDAFTKLRDTLKSTLLDLLYQMTVRKWIFNIVASVTGGATGSVAQQVLGNSGTGSMIGTASNLNSLWGAGSQFFGGTTAGASGASLAYANGVGMIGGDSIGALYSANGGWAGVSTGSAASGAAAGSSTSFAGIPVVGWIAMGMMASSQAYDQGFRSDTSGKGLNALNPNHMLNATDRVLQGLGIDARTAAILSGSALGSAAQNFIFGGSGDISALGGGLQGTIGGAGSSLSAYNVYKQDHRGFLGIGSYTTENREYSAASAGLTQYVDATTKLVTDSVKNYAKALGLSTDAVDGFTKQIDVSLAGLSPEQQQEAIAKALGGFGEELVQSLYGSALAGLEKAGETQGATLQRLASNLMTVNGYMDALGATLYDVGVSGAKAASSLVDAVGGLEQLNGKLSSYYQNFYSPQERADQSFKDLSLKLAAGGIDISAQSLAALSEAQVRAYIDAAASDHTEEGIKKFALLLDLQNQWFEAHKTSVDALAQIASTMASAQDALANANAKLVSAQTALANKLAQQAEEQARALKEAQDYLSGVRTNIADWVAHLNSSEQGGLSDQQRRDAAWAAFMTKRSLAMGGDRAAMSGITGVADQYINTVRNTSSSAFDEAHAIAKIKAMVSNLPNQVSAEQFIVNAVNASADTIAAEIERLKTEKLVAELTVSAQSEITKAITFIYSTDAIPAEWKKIALADLSEVQKTINYVTGSTLSPDDKRIALATDDSILKTINAAVGAMDPDAWKIAIAQDAIIRKTIEASGGVLTADQKLLLNDIAEYNKLVTIDLQMNESALQHTQSILMQMFGTTSIDKIISGLQGGTPDALIDYFVKTEFATKDEATAVHNTYTAAKAYGLTMADIARATGYSIEEIHRLADKYGIPYFAAGGDHLGGIRLVGERGPELEVTGPSRIFNADQTRNILSGGFDGQDIVNELRELRAQVGVLRDQLDQANRHAKSTSDAVNGRGEQPMLVEIEP